MAKNIFDFSKFTFTAEQIRDIKELLFDEILQAPELASIHTMFSGIVYDKEIGFVGEGGLVGKAAQGCDPTPQDWNIGSRKVVWTPKTWEVLIQECAKDLESTMAVYCMNTGVARHDLTNTDYMAIVSQVLAVAIKKMLIRLAWFGDTDATNVSDDDTPGIITDGVDVSYFTLIDGFFKQIQSAMTEHSDHLVTITANAKTTKAEQMAITGDDAYDILTKMYYKAPVTMRANMRFLVTQSLADAYQQYLTGKNLESTYKNLVDGVPSLSLLGVPVIPMPIWDEMIQSYNDLGTKYNYPHRAVLVEQATLAIGTPSEGALEDVDIFYDKMSRKNRLEASDKIDAKLLNDVRLIYAQ